MEARPDSEPPIPLAPGEAIAFTESRAKVLRFKAEAKAWGDLGVGTLRVVEGGKGGARVVFSAANGSRERVLLSGGAIGNLTPSPPAAAGAKPGGLSVSLLVVDAAGAAQMTLIKVKVGTQAQQDAIEAAIVAAKAKGKGGGGEAAA